MAYNPFKEVCRPFRSQAEAQALVGETRRIGAQDYRITGFNDLGCLYGVKVNGNRIGKTEYVLD